MDISIVATQALAFLSPYLAKGGEAIASGLGKDLWELIKKPFRSDKEKKLVDDLQQKPGDLEQRGMVKQKLSEKLEEDPELLKELVAVIGKLQQAGNVANITQTHSGTGDNVGGNKIINN
ncbi:MAG: hypothetical protein QM764_20755 [Chitinophagaceae bacterium]